MGFWLFKLLSKNIKTFGKKNNNNSNNSKLKGIGNITPITDNLRQESIGGRY